MELNDSMTMAARSAGHAFLPHKGVEVPAKPGRGAAYAVDSSMTRAGSRVSTLRPVQACGHWLTLHEYVSSRSPARTQFNGAYGAYRDSQ